MGHFIILTLYHNYSFASTIHIKNLAVRCQLLHLSYSVLSYLNQAFINLNFLMSNILVLKLKYESLGCLSLRWWDLTINPINREYSARILSMYLFDMKHLIWGSGSCRDTCPAPVTPSNGALISSNYEHFYKIF